MVEKCDGIKFDLEVIELLNINHDYMKVEEEKMVLNCLKGMYQGMKSIELNYGQITDYGIEIIAEAIKFNKNIRKIDLNTNKITDIGMYPLSQGLLINKSIVHLKLSYNKIKDKGCEYLYDGLKENEQI